MRRSSPFVKLVLGLLAVLPLAVACGGGADKGKDFEKPTAGRAGQVAHAALIEPGDLSGSWVNYSTDNFSSDDTNLPSSGNCEPARNLAQEMSRSNIARAQRSIQLELPGYKSKAQVEMHVRIFDTKKTAEDYLNRNRAVLSSDSYIRCLQDGFTAFFGPNARVRYGEARGKAPRDGLTAAIDQDVQSDQEILSLHTDYYAWVQNNAYVLVLISGPRVADSADVVKEALEKVQKKVDEAFAIPKAD
jgi:hypothetical protein